MTAQQLHLDDSQLSMIINETDSDLSQIRTLNVQVLSLSDVIAQNSQSDSGRIMQQKLATWSGDFAQIERNLSSLNDKAKALRTALLNAGQGAASAANTAG
jgi:hypothetical protein